MDVFAKKVLGIDIGVSSIKVVKLKSRGRKSRLENYLEFILPEKSGLSTFDKNNMLLNSEMAAGILGVILRRLKIKDTKVSFALPDFSTFFTTISLPPMPEAEIPQAIEFEARHYIPLPLNQVTFDWQIIAKEKTQGGLKAKVLLVAVPNRVLESYQHLALLCHFEIKGMQAEVFGLIKSSIAKQFQDKTVCLIDFGWQSTTVSIVRNKNLLLSQSFDISGNGLTMALAGVLKTNFETAEKLKRAHGLDPRKEEMFRALSFEIDKLIIEIKNVLKNFQEQEKITVYDIALAGGTAMLTGLKEYIGAKLDRNVSVVNPFDNVYHPAKITQRLKELGPSFAVALGTAMAGIEL